MLPLIRFPRGSHVNDMAHPSKNFLRDGVLLRPCSRCGGAFPLHYYHDHSGGGKMAHCKSCGTAAVRKSYYKHHEVRRTEARDDQRKRKAPAKEFVDRIKNVCPCQDCRRPYPAVCMDFDHRPGLKKVDDISRLLTRPDDLCLELLKCDLVCANCHRVRTAERRNV